MIFRSFIVALTSHVLLFALLTLHLTSSVSKQKKTNTNLSVIQVYLTSQSQPKSKVHQPRAKAIKIHKNFSAISNIKGYLFFCMTNRALRKLYKFQIF